MADELKPCKYCGCDWGHTGECPLDSPGAVERARLKSENDALRAEVAALKHYQELDGLAMRLANNELAKRRREIAALKAECAGAWRVHSEVVAELKAKLAKYTEPLTPMQADDISREFNGHGKLVMDMDAAIRKVRSRS